MTDHPIRRYDPEMDPTGTARIGQLIVNCLAIGGGYLVGWFAVAALMRLAIVKAGPPSLRKLAKNIGGIAVAVLVAMIVFGHGLGWTLMGGGAPGSENGGEVSSPVSTVATTRSNETSDANVPTALKPAPAIDERIRITMLGGDDVRESRFYLVNDENKAKTLDETKAAITAFRDAHPGRRVGVEVRFPASNALSQDHPAVTRLARWARTEAGLTVSFPAD